MNKHFFKAVVISISLLFAMAGQVNAARLGGGKSIGKAPSAPMQKQAAPVQKPTQQAQPAAPTPAPQAAAPSRFGGMGGIIGGLAAGLGIGYLLSHLGLGEGASSLITGLLNGLFIACGPLQAMYIYAAGTGSFFGGATSLFAFGLGTSRLAGQLYNFPHMSSVYENDLRVLKEII